jgi:hypothetical protein
MRSYIFFSFRIVGFEAESNVSCRSIWLTVKTVNRRLTHFFDPDLSGLGDESDRRAWIPLPFPIDQPHEVGQGIH